MNSVNPYQAPGANLDISDQQEYVDPKFFSISGRIGRLRFLSYSFGYGLIGYLIMLIVLFGAGGAGAGSDSPAFIAVMVLAYAYFIGTGLMLARRRSHDMNKNGWFSLLYLIPFVSLIFLFIPGTKGENRFGKQPRPNKGSGMTIVVVGFLLIAIIGIVAAIAIPAYQDYVNRAKAANGESVVPGQ